MRLTKTRKFELDTAEDALNKIKEVSNGDYKVDIKPFKGMKIGRRNKFLVIKQKGTWYLKLC